MSNNQHNADCNCEDIKKAEANLEHAVNELRKAEHHVKQAEAELARAQERCNKHEIVILYDGVRKTFETKPEELVKTLLDQATHAFGPLPNPHTLSLFTEAGEELKDGQTLHEAGIKLCENLLLRPSKVKGGTK